MFKRLKFYKNESGAIAIETALLTPMLVFALLKATDIALQVHTSQQMAKATKSGIQYVVNGGRDEVSIRGIVQDSFSRKISDEDLLVTAYCGCLSEVDNPDGAEIKDDEASGVYTKFKTQISDNMCIKGCDSGSQISALVEIEFSYDLAGILTDSRSKTRLQTRIR